MRLLVATMALATLAACSYDWQVGSPTGSGGDAGTGGTQGGGGDAGTDAGADADAGPSCAALLADLADARAKAKACSTIGTPCPASILDECGCKSAVVSAGSAASIAYAAAVESVVDAGCSVTCAGCLVSPGTCLLTPAQICTP